MATTALTLHPPENFNLAIDGQIAKLKLSPNIPVIRYTNHTALTQFIAWNYLREHGPQARHHTTPEGSYYRHCIDKRCHNYAVLITSIYNHSEHNVMYITIVHM